MLLVAFLLVPVPATIVVATALVAWRQGSLRESPQERVDRQFHRMIARLRQHGPDPRANRP